MQEVKDAILELDFLPFRKGKIFLDSVTMKNNQVFAYNITFYGNTVSLKDLLGDDELSVLDSLDDDFTHNYNSSQVKVGIQNGLFSQSIIYPLITHTKRLYYDSNDSNTYSGNLFHDTTTASTTQGLSFEDVKPAIKCLEIIEAIETKYSIEFTIETSLVQPHLAIFTYG